MKILVTGGAGFIGSNFVEYLLLNDHRRNQIDALTVLDKLTYAGDLANLESVASDAKFKFIKGDICDSKLVEKIIVDYDWIVNFAAETHVDRSLEDPNEFVRSNVLGTATLLNLAIRHNVKKFLQVSTDEVYGSITTGSWDEDSTINPRSPYSASKASADFIALSFFVSHNLDVRITRCSNNYGPRQNLEKMVPKIINSLKLDLPIPLYGDGQNIRDWLYVEDHCQGIWLAMINGRAGQVYNLGGGIEYTNLELITTIAKEFDIATPLIEFVADRKGHDFRYSLNYKKATKELDYQPLFTFSEAITRTIRSYS